MPSIDKSNPYVLSDDDPDISPKPIFTTAAGQLHDSSQISNDLLEIKQELSKLKSSRKQYKATYDATSHSLLINDSIVQLIPYSKESLLCETIYKASLNKVWEIEEILEKWSITHDYPARVVSDAARRLNDKTKHLLDGKLFLTKANTLRLNRMYI